MDFGGHQLTSPMSIDGFFESVVDSLGIVEHESRFKFVREICHCLVETGCHDARLSNAPRIFNNRDRVARDERAHPEDMIAIAMCNPAIYGTDAHRRIKIMGAQ